MIQIIFAVLAGILTVGAPCVLPLLPVILGASVGRTGQSRPIYIIAGFVITFAAMGMFLSFLTMRLGFDAGALRAGAIVLLGIFGLLMVWPKPFELISARLTAVVSMAGKAGGGRFDNLGGFIVGMTLGVVWTPCAGPVLGAILTLVAAEADEARAAALLVAYSAGAGVPMLIVAYGSQYVTTRIRNIARYSAAVQRVFGGLIVLLAFAMYYNYDVAVGNRLAALFPPLAGVEKRLAFEGPDGRISLGDYGPAPELRGISGWINSGPLTIKGLKGKVVLVDFWTYSCINCVRTFPFLAAWHEAYGDKGLVILGVHTPEFPFERKMENVVDAVRRFEIKYPVALDNDYATWNAYGNRYWPAEYLIDGNGVIVYKHFGEGEYARTENAIRRALGMEADPGARTAELGDIRSPEIYFGAYRLTYLAPEQSPSDKPAPYALPDRLGPNNFALEGLWRFTGDHAELTGPEGRIRLRFYSARLYMVAAGQAGPLTLKIIVDGKEGSPVTIGPSKLYTLFDSEEYGEHTIDIIIPGPGLEAFTFTFG